MRWVRLVSIACLPATTLAARIPERATLEDPMKFAALIEYTQDKDKIAQLRPPHREYLLGLRKANKAVMAGPFTDDSGGLLVYEAETKEDVEKMIRDDPFGQGGVFVSWTIRPWNLLWVNQDLTPA